MNSTIQPTNYNELNEPTTNERNKGAGAHHGAARARAAKGPWGTKAGGATCSMGQRGAGWQVAGVGRAAAKVRGQKGGMRTMSMNHGTGGGAAGGGGAGCGNGAGWAARVLAWAGACTGGRPGRQVEWAAAVVVGRKVGWWCGGGGWRRQAGRRAAGWQQEGSGGAHARRSGGGAAEPAAGKRWRA